MQPHLAGHAGVCEIILDRPEALNALNAELIAELDVALSDFEKNPEIGCVVLTGSEKAFAAGADIKEMRDKSFAEALLEDFLGRWDVVARARKPIIAAVSGFALGFFLISAGPIGFQYAAEITFPTPEGTSNGLIQLFGQAAVVFVYIMDALKTPDGSFTPSLLLAVGLLIVSAAIITQLHDPHMGEPTSGEQVGGEQRTDRLPAPERA